MSNTRHASCSSQNSRIPQQSISFAQPLQSNCSISNPSVTSRRLKSLPITFESEETFGTEDCNGNFTPSGSNPPKTVGALSKQHDFFAKFAPCGHWSSCRKNECGVEKYFEPVKSSCGRAPYGPYGPWSKVGPALFTSPRADFIKSVFPHQKRRSRNGTNSRPVQPMGKLAPWPLSGSCRYSGRPFGPCRPLGSFKNRGPFGYWNCKSLPEHFRPITPAQPCWKKAKRGQRPCTPCHRPLFRPCKPCA